MSDMVDDLHAAEDLIGQLQNELRRALLGEVQDKERPALMTLSSEPYCRPGCGFLDSGACESEDPGCCGCPCHHEIAEVA